MYTYVGEYLRVWLPNEDVKVQGTGSCKKCKIIYNFKEYDYCPVCGRKLLYDKIKKPIDLHGYVRNEIGVDNFMGIWKDGKDHQVLVPNWHKIEISATLITRETMDIDITPDDFNFEADYWQELFTLVGDDAYFKFEQCIGVVRI